MAGGRRVGAGRKPGEKTVVRRIPVGCLSAVDAVIAAYRKNVTAINGASSVPLETVTEIKKPEITPLESVTEIKKAVKPSNQPKNVKPSLSPAQKVILRQLESLAKPDIADIRAKFGSLSAAVLAGVRLDLRTHQIFFPPKFSKK